MRRSGSFGGLLKLRRRSFSKGDAGPETGPEAEGGASPGERESLSDIAGPQRGASAGLPLSRSASSPAMHDDLSPLSPKSALSAVPPPTDMPDVSPANFESVRLLGAGSYARVYVVRARNLSMDVDGSLFVAKVFNKAEVEALDCRGNVENEIATLKGNDHPFLLRLFCAFQTRKRVYLVTEYCAGGDLAHLLQSNPGSRVSETHAQFYAAEILLGLERLHLDGVLYRDLKPDNVLIHASGHILLADFDLTKRARRRPGAAATDEPPASPRSSAGRRGLGIKPALRRNNSDVRLRRHLQKHGPAVDVEGELALSVACVGVCGTVEYIAPEVLAGQTYSGAADWWSFGVLLYKLVYGATPFADEHPDAVMGNVRGKKLVFPSAPRVSKSCRALIAALLNRDPAKRLVAPQTIRAHPFFRSVDNWALLRNRDPPYVPQLRGDEDTRHFFIAGVERDEDFELDVPLEEELVDPLVSSSDEEEEEVIDEPVAIQAPPLPGVPASLRPGELVHRDSVWDVNPADLAALGADMDEEDADAGAGSPSPLPVQGEPWPSIEYWNPRMGGWTLEGM